MSNTYKGLFIAFEGGEGSGKTTQATLLRDGLDSHDVNVHLTREPGDTLIGKHLRGILLDQNAGEISQKTEALLFAADRAEHVEKVIRPVLEMGLVVICDRYSASTLAYQSYAGGLDRDGVKAMSDWASGGLQPDITFLLDVDPMIGLERSHKAGNGNVYEEKALEYHDKVRRGFLEQKDDSWVVLPGNLSEGELHDKILDHVLHVLHVVRRFRGLPLPGLIEGQKVNRLCTKATCDNPHHQYGHVIDEAFEPMKNTEDLSDLAQRVEAVAPKVVTIGTCGFEECVNHPAPDLKVVK